MVGIKDEPNSNDELGVLPYASALAQFIQQSETPITIGVQGPWGSGKTSLLYSIWSKIEAEDNTTAQIWVNSWEHSLMSSSEETLIKITNEIANKIVAFDKAKERGEKLRKITGKLLMGGLAAGAAIASGAKGADLIAEMLSDENASPIKQLKKELQASVKSVSALNSNPKTRFVIYIDDLDRIEPSDAVSLLELLKNIFSVEQCIFVLAIDYEVVVKGLSKKFGERTKQNEREYKAFFDKVIQLTFKMPMSNYNIGNYVYQLLYKTQFLKDATLDKEELEEFFYRTISLTVQGNPRSIKRLVNSLTLMAITAEQVSDQKEKNLDVNFEKQLLFALVCLQISMPDIYALLAREPDFLSWNEDTLTENLGLLGTDRKFEEISENAKLLDEFDEDWEQFLLKFSYFKGYSISETTNCSKLLGYIKELLKTHNEGTELLKSVLKRTSVTSISNDGNIGSKDETDQIIISFWSSLYSYFGDKHPDFQLPKEEMPTKGSIRWSTFKNGYKVNFIFRKQKKFVSIKLENYRANVSPERFKEDTSRLLEADNEFSLEIQESRKRMDAFAIKNNVDIENEHAREELFEWVRSKINVLIDNTKSLQ